MLAVFNIIECDQLVKFHTFPFFKQTGHCCRFFTIFVELSVSDQNNIVCPIDMMSCSKISHSE